MLTLEQVMNRSAARLAGLHPVIERAARLLIDRCYAKGVPIVITQGLRTIAEQNTLYAQGRSKPGAIVTNARGGYSYHNFGLAVDFALLLPDGRQVSWDMKRDGDGDGTADWAEVVRQAKALGFEWGGDWSGFKDYPHLQMDFGLSTADLRAGKEPPRSRVESAEKRLNQMEEEADELSQAERQELANLRTEVGELRSRIEALAKSRDVLKQGAEEQGRAIIKVQEQANRLEERASLKAVPDWAKPAVQAAAKAGWIDTPEGGSYDFYRFLKVLHSAGLLPPSGKEGK